MPAKNKTNKQAVKVPAFRSRDLTITRIPVDVLTDAQSIGILKVAQQRDITANQAVQYLANQRFQK